MNKTSQKPSSDAIHELIIFTVGDLLCGLNIVNAQEINRNLAITPVPKSPPYVRGVLNLRGQVITVIDLRIKLELHPIDIRPEMRIIVVRNDNDAVGLLVDGVDDIVAVRESKLTPPPSNIGGVRGEFFSAVYKMDSDLAAVLDIEEVLGKAPSKALTSN